MPNKVLFFVDNPVFGGVEQALLQLMEGLDRNMWEPVLVHHSSRNIQYLTQKVDGLHIRRIETPVMPLGVTGMKKIGPFLKILRRERPAIFHAHLSWPLACKWGVAAALLARVPAVVATEGLFLDVGYSRAARLQQRILAAGVGKYIAVSCDIANKLSGRFKIPKHKICVIHNGVEVARFDHATLPRELTELKQAPAKALILTVARLEKQKGHLDLLQAAAEIPEAMFVLLGDGPDRPVLEEQARNLGLAERVVFLGFRADVASWLAACDVFVLSSLYEGLPIAVLEAMAAGKPVIATAIPGNDEAVVHGQTGYLVPPHDPVALAAAIRFTLADSSARERMGKAAKEIASREFSLKEIIGQTSEVYAECLADRYPRHE